MDRRESIKTLTLGALASTSLLKRFSEEGSASAFESDWHRWPDMRWAGPAYWGNRLQDWRVRGGEVECRVAGPNRSLHCLTHRLGDTQGDFDTAVDVRLLGNKAAPEGYAGFRLGAQGPFDDYRSAAVFGTGLDAGLTAAGRLFIGERRGAEATPAGEAVHLRLAARPQGGRYRITLEALHGDRGDREGEPLARLTAEDVPSEALTGNVALVSHFEADEDAAGSPPVRFGRWVMRGSKLVHDPDATFGPVCFAQYTLHRGTLKLTAQLAPIEAIGGSEVALEIEEDGRWRSLGQSAIDPLARIARFRVEGWDRRADVPYRVRVTIPLQGGAQDFFYHGTLAREPVEEDRVKVAVFSCNADYGFPDAEVVRHVSGHRPHLAVFLGDQFYESSGGFGIQTSPLEMACLDVLHKWYLFGWSYRDIFRHVPSAFIPDDHDVYHGNLWGEGGEDAPTDEGWGYAAQDHGGYKMPPTWVNVIQRAETSHLPDPYDPTPVKQGIDVYYTGWDYGGVSFAILEDRKFKSAPGNVLPAEAEVVNGYITNPAFDVKVHRDLPEAHLLGERQMRFLDAWTADWGSGVQMKAVLSQTNFCAAHTLPEGSTHDRAVPTLPIPEPGEYVQGDEPATDMDPNGWPQNRRDEVLRLLRKGFAFHIAGDQHLATVMQYGVDDFGDAGFAFTGPALNNLWPRRWWPSPEAKQRPLPGKPAYTGSFFDAFGNRLTMYAAANPHETGREPSILYDRATGYGIVTFDKAQRAIRMECWPRYVDPARDPGGQYEGWPIEIRQEDNYGREAQAYLPELQITGLADPVLQVIDEADGEVAYALRLGTKPYRPKVFREGTYTLRLGNGQRWLRTLEGVASRPAGQTETLEITLD